MDEERASLLAVAVRDGDRLAFRELVEGLTRSLMAVAYRYTGDWESSRDLCQDTWVTVWQQIRGYDPERPFLPWLRAIHRNGCLSCLRRAARTREQARSLAELPAPSTRDPFTELGRAELRRHLDLALVNLSESQRRVFALVEIEQVRPKDAARLLGMNPTTLRTTLHFARRALARALQAMEEEP